MRTKGKTFSGKQLSIPVPRKKQTKMQKLVEPPKSNILTLRLENGYATELDNIMKDVDEKTCAGAIKKLIVNYAKDQEIISLLRMEVIALKTKMNKQTEILSGLKNLMNDLNTFELPVILTHDEFMDLEDSLKNSGK